jgi:hypothetical protein
MVWPPPHLGGESSTIDYIAQDKYDRFPRLPPAYNRGESSRQEGFEEELNVEEEDVVIEVRLELVNRLLVHVIHL